MRPTLSNVRAVLFDAVGTVLHPAPPAAVAYYQAGRQFGSRQDPTEVAERYDLAFRRQESFDQSSDDGRTDEARERRRWRQIVSDVFDDVRDAEGLFQHLWAHFASPAHWGVFSDVAAAWEELARMNLIIGLASNFDSRLAAVCEGHEPLTRCQHVFVSSRLGVRKPHQGFFAAIERSLNLPPDQILLVGDNLQTDYQAALAAGWQSLLISRESPPPADVAGISDLGQLLPLLGQNSLKD
jgi:putative hydrolase of the HAD superfamily